MKPETTKSGQKPICSKIIANSQAASKSRRSRWVCGVRVSSLPRLRKVNNTMFLKIKYLAVTLQNPKVNTFTHLFTLLNN